MFSLMVLLFKIISINRSIATSFLFVILNCVSEICFEMRESWSFNETYISTSALLSSIATMFSRCSMYAFTSAVHLVKEGFCIRLYFDFDWLQIYKLFRYMYNGLSICTEVFNAPSRTISKEWCVSVALSRSFESSLNLYRIAISFFIALRCPGGRMNILFVFLYSL